jgi:hypothetical protein
MPVTAATDPAGRFSIVTVTDPYTIDEWRTGMLAAGADVTFRALRRMLIDRRGSTPPTTAFVDLMIRFAAEHPADIGTRVAVVVSDIAGFGMARMAELKASGSVPEASIMVFHDYAGAVDWLVADQS